jgi:lipopolysaccharide/colanic/teichoic acid biosynthesis glycosyltransferase
MSGAICLDERALSSAESWAALKRVPEFCAALLAVALLHPLLLVAAALVRFDSPGPILFKQERVGRGFRRFLIYKFRTMTVAPPRQEGDMAFGDPGRVTRMGKVLRGTKLDELPQLFNILKGDMSFVGPRPELPRYVELFKEDYAQILRVRPGLTDLASLKYRDEETILSRSPSPRETYLREILPDKIRLGKEYLERSSLLFDAELVARTAAALFVRRPASS